MKQVVEIGGKNAEGKAATGKRGKGKGRVFFL
jgi:hypothetical protein